MFSFLKFLNSKSDADKKKAPNNLSGKTINLNSPEASAFNIFHNKSPVARKPIGSNNSSLRSSCKETVTSPGFSYRIAQRAREMRSTTNTDLSNLSTSYTLENNLNGSNTINGNNSMRDGYDKKRKLMETLDNFGVRKRTRQESSVDAFVNRRRKTISESNTPDRLQVMNGHNHRSTQPIPIVSSKNANVDNKKTKRHGDFGTNVCHSQKKPKTRNNEILSSYSSSQFLLKSGQKRPYPSDHEDHSPNRKHCKSCTCCGSTVLLKNDQNNLNKSDKTTETDLSDDLVTVAASRIFNRSGKTQVVKKITMKTILDEVFDDVDPVPYTSMDKLEEKKKKAGKKDIVDKQNIGTVNMNDSNQPAASDSLITTPKLNEIQPVITTNSLNLPVTSATLVTTTPSIQTTSLIFGHNPSENVLKVNEGNKINTPLQINFGSSTAIAVSVEVNNKLTNEGAEKLNDSVKSDSSNNAFETSKKNSVQMPNQQPKLHLQSPDKTENTNDKSQTEKQNNSPSDKNVPSFQFTVPTSTPGGPVLNSSTTNNPKINENNLPAAQFGSPVENSSKQPTFTVAANEKPSTPVIKFGDSVIYGKQTTPVSQFGSPNVDHKQSTHIMQFGAPKSDDKLSVSTPVLQFGSPKVDNKQLTPVMQFGAPKVDDKQTTPIMQFGAPKVDGKQSIPVLQFGTTKDAENPTSTSLFSFGNNQKSIDNSKPAEPIKFQFGSTKPDSTSSTESKNVVFGSNNSQNQNIFSFGKTDNNALSLTTGNPTKYDTTIGTSSPKIQFGALSTPVFGTSNSDQSKPQFTNSVSQSNDGQVPKLAFGGQTTENKSTSSASGMLFANNTANAVFQFNSSSSKLDDKPSKVPNNSFQFSSTKAAPTFGASASKDKLSFQFNAQKPEEPKTQFSTPTFGSQNSTIAPFKFGSNDKPASFGSTFSAPNQSLQFTNNTEKTAEPFKFGSTAPTSNAFQFSANKTDGGSVKFGQTSNTFSTPAFSGFGSTAPPQTTTFGSVQPSQPSPFGNMTSPNAAPTFGSVAAPSSSNTFGSIASPPSSTSFGSVASPPSSNTFGTNQGFQFGSTNNAPNNPSTFAFGSTQQPPKPEGAFNFNAVSSPPAVSPFQFGPTPSALSTPQFGGTQTQGSFGFGSPPMTATVMPGSSQPLFSMGTAPAGERRKAKAVRRRQ